MSHCSPQFLMFLCMTMHLFLNEVQPIELPGEDASEHPVLFSWAQIQVKNRTSGLPNGVSAVSRGYYRDLKYIDQHLFSEAAYLRIKTRNMPVLYEGAIKSLPHLLQLRLSSCDITNIMPKAFKNLPKLASIQLKGNLLTKISEGIFSYLTVKEVYLHRNKISVIEDRAFHHMPHLELIKLNGNKLKEWNSQWFYDTPKLTNIYFRRNKITELPARAFANIVGRHSVHGKDHLYDTNIFLSHNHISHIHPWAFRGLTGLNALWLDRNEIAELPKDLFSEMVELNQLHLRKNRLTTLDPRIFEKFPQMDALDISRNNIQCLSYEIAKVVQKIHVGGNDEMDCDCFRNLLDRLSETDRENRITDDGECFATPD